MKTRMTLLGITFLAGTVYFAGNAIAASNVTAASNSTNEGLFVGIGANFNSLNLTQSSWGKGVSNIQTTTGANSNGVGEGSGPPFHSTNNALGPSIQAGYFKHIRNTPNLIGVKFFYQYLDSTATNANLFIPQLGQTTSAITGVTSSLYGYVNGTSVQPTINQDMALLLFAGRTFGDATLYVGAGPSLVNLTSKNYYSIGYATFEGVVINVTGLVSYSSPSFWALGATGQIGANYFFSPSWFVDMSYSYTITRGNTTKHQQTFTNTSTLGGVTYTTSGTLYTKDTMSVKNQTLMLSVNKVFDI